MKGFQVKKTDSKVKLVESRELLRQLQPRLELLVLGHSQPGKLRMSTSLTFGTRNPIQRTYYEQTEFGATINTISAEMARLRIVAAFGQEAGSTDTLSVVLDGVENGRLASIRFVGPAATLLEHRPETRDEIAQAVRFTLNETLTSLLIAELGYARDTGLTGDSTHRMYEASPIITSNITAGARRIASRRSGAAAISTTSGPAITWRRAAIAGCLAAAVFFGFSMLKKAAPQAQPPQPDPLADASSMMDAAAIKNKVNDQLALLRQGGGNPYSGVDTKNIQIETLKKLGFDVGKAKSGCLVGMGGPG